MTRKIFIMLFISMVPLFGQNNDQIYKDLLKKVETSVTSGEKEKAYYYITRYIGLVLTDSSTNMKVDDISQTIESLGLKPISFISGKYSSEFLEWYFGSTYYMWGSPKERTDEDDLSSVINETYDKNYYVGIIGHPAIEVWSIIDKGDGKTAISYLHLIDCKKPPRIFVSYLKKQNQKPLSFYLRNNDLRYHFFWKPEIIDTNDDGKTEVILRYNVARADGFYQECDVYAISDTGFIFLDSLVGDPEGFARHTSGTTFQMGYTFPSSSEIGHLGYDLYKIKNYKFINGKFHETQTEETIDNILWSDKFRKYFYEE